MNLFYTISKILGNWERTTERDFLKNCPQCGHSAKLNKRALSDSNPCLMFTVDCHNCEISTSKQFKPANAVKECNNL